ncbi:MAG: Ig-like domain-containing protein, partial [Anaerolineales bacterium]|nr:Ig-like domain-containing protein [Anaerolineales bacterium]
MNSFRVLSLVFILILGLSACRQEQAPAKATAVPTSTFAVSTPTSQPTATPQTRTWPPQVVYSSPAPGETVLLDGAMTIRFDQPMDQAAVEAAFVIDPPPADGLFTWPRSDTLVYTPVQPWERQQTYRVRIGKTAVSQSGIPLIEDVELSLQTVGYLAVSQAMPSGMTV